MEVEVFNDSTFGLVHVGRASAPLKTLVSEFNQLVSVVVPLVHYEKGGKSKDGTQKGQVIIRAFLEAKSPPVVPAAGAAVAKPAPAAKDLKDQQYDTTQPVKLKLEHLQVRNLVDKGGMLDKQDPLLRITIGDFPSFETERYVYFPNKAN
jgi:hypothetical protein